MRVSSFPCCGDFFLTLRAAGEDLRNRTTKVDEKKAKPRNFFKKFWELQSLMLAHNAGLTASHPYATSPINWPFLVSGISFWTDNDKKQQVYFIGNVGSWWACSLSIAVILGVLTTDALARRRGVLPIPECTFEHLYLCSD